MDAGQGELSSADKKTLAFGLAVAVLSSCPASPPSGSSAAEAAKGYSDRQGASKKLRLWQDACLGGLAQAGSRPRPHPAATDHRRPEERRNAPFDGIGDAPRNQLDRWGVPPGSLASPAAGLLASDGASDLRALRAVAFSGAHSEGARAVRREALEGLWQGDCSPGMVALFAKEMLEQVVLRGQGGYGLIYRQVLDLMVSVASDVAEAAGDDNIAGAAGAAKATTLARRFDVGFAVSEAFDATLVHLAKELRGGIGGGGGRSSGGYVGVRQGTRRPSQSSAAVARAAGAGLFLDAYEAVAVCLLRAFNNLAEGSSAAAAAGGGGSSSDSLRPNHAHPYPSRDSERRGDGQSPYGPAAVPRGGDAGARRQEWTQRKLQVLAEATTTMSSFRMGQLRLHCIVGRVYEGGRLA